jgi:hypothetical protein
MLLEPREPENDILPSEVGYREGGAFDMALIPNYQVDNFANSTSLIRSTIYVVHRDGPRKGSGSEAMFLYIPMADELTGCATVDQCRTGFNFGGVSGLKFDLDG